MLNGGWRAWIGEGDTATTEATPAPAKVSFPAAPRSQTLTDKQVDKVHAALGKVARDRFEATIR